MEKAKSHYRPDIDGLRALAVISVLLFHAEISGFSGGFIGVDVFFVISGFLITSILLRQMKQKNFSIWSFWERRMRRILPALFLVALSVSLAGYIFFIFPMDLENLGKSLVALGMFLSNFFFVRRDTYFDPSVESLPLLHTWSLAVEEQFYFIFPLFLLGLFFFFKKHISKIIILVTLVSFVLSVYLVNIFPGDSLNYFFIDRAFWNNANSETFAFYLLPARAWELLIGATLAASAFTVKNKWRSEILSFAGICALLYAVFMYDNTTAFPGVAALLPVLGSAAIIAANNSNKTYVYKFLSLKFMVGVGLISYPLYLWHWPIFAFAKTLFGEITLLQTCALLLLSAYLAWLTYNFLERPFLERKIIPGQRTMLLVGSASLVCTCLLGYALLKVDASSRVPDYASEVIEASTDLGSDYDRCFINYGLAKLSENGPCAIGVDKGLEVPDFVLFGNSHAGSIVSTLSEVATENNAQGTSFIGSGCVPLAGIDHEKSNSRCDDFTSLALSYLGEVPVENVLIVANWNDLIDSDYSILFKTSSSSVFSAQDRRIALETGLRNTIVRLQAQEGRNIYILKQPPKHSDYNPRELFYKAIRHGSLDTQENLSAAQYKASGEFVTDILAKFENEYGITVLDPYEFFCATGICAIGSEHRLFYKDSGHLNYFGANQITPLLTEFVQDSSTSATK